MTPSPTTDAPRARTYVLVWLALVVLATASLLAATASLGPWSLVIALAIAGAKAVLVLLFFMHLAHGQPVHRLVIAISIVFVALIIGGVMADVGTRGVASSYVDDRGQR